MAYDYQLPALQMPDVLGSFLRGKQSVVDEQAQQQNLQFNQLKLDQLRQMIQDNKAGQDLYKQQASRQPQQAQPDGLQEFGKTYRTPGQTGAVRGYTGVYDAQQNQYDPAEHPLPNMPQPRIDPMMAAHISSLNPELGKQIEEQNKAQQEDYQSKVKQVQLGVQQPVAVLQSQ
jgi:hypothetical protein